MKSPVIFGIRHLSPACAHHVRALLDRHQPKLVLVEGPSDLNDQLPWLCHPRVRYPVAILAYTRKAPVRSILYPFAIYSPEIQAILWAKEHGVTCRFMDLPSEVFLALSAQEPTEEQPASTENACQKLEQLAGEDTDSFWERTLEHIPDPELCHQGCRAFGRELRHSVVEAPRQAAENAIREAYMRREIAQAMQQGIAAEKIFCVCGAFHVEGLEFGEPMTDGALAQLPRVDSSATLMPYSYYRLTTRSGYGAGNKAPAYFHLLWEQLQAGCPQELPHQYLTNLAQAHREAGNLVSSAQVIDAVRLSKSLCSLRGSTQPILRDLQDAAMATMGDGKYSALAVAFAQTQIGTAIGYLPHGISRTSIQEDFYRQLKRLKLERFAAAQAQELRLDLREKRNVKTQEAAFADLNRSAFLHRLRILGISFPKLLPSRQENATWGEYWSLQWTPEAEIQIVESALLGDTVEQAASLILAERGRSCVSISDAAKIFQDAFLCAMPSSCAQALVLLQSVSIDAAALSELAETAVTLSGIIRYGDLRRFDGSQVQPLLEQLYLRGCLTLEDACLCDAAAAGRITEAMEQWNLLTLHHDFLEESRWLSLLERVSNRDDLNTRCSGFAMAILLERGEADEGLLSRELSRRLSPGIPAELGAGWFEGLAAKNRYALIARLSLWKHLDEYLQTLDDTEFRRSLVFLRRAFSGFTPSEKSDIAENLGEIWGLNAAEALLEAPTNQEQAVFDSLDGFDFDDI